MLRRVIGVLSGLVLACGPTPPEEQTGGGSSGSSSSSASTSSASTSSSSGGAPTTSVGTTVNGTTTTSVTTTNESSTTVEESTFIISPDLGPPVPCMCAPDELCTYQGGIDSVWKICVIPPEGCDPQMFCSQACATACKDPPALPNHCDAPDPGEAMACPGWASPCSVWAQNCPEGQKCEPNLDFVPIYELECVPLAEPAPGIGEPCVGALQSPTGHDDCEKGAVCWQTGGDAPDMACVAHCGGTPADPSCPPGQACWTANDNTVTACFPTCDPLVQDCPQGQVCGLGLHDFVCLPDLSGAQGQELDACESDSDCDPGLLCAPKGPHKGCIHGSCCHESCDLGAPACDANQVCMSAFEVVKEEPPPAEWADVGLCVSK